MENLQKLKNIVESEILKLEYFNTSFMNEYTLGNVIEDFNYILEDNTYKVDFTLSDTYVYKNQSASLKIFTFDENDSKLGFTKQQIQEDILNDVYCYVGICNQDENLIKFINVAEININLFEKYGFDKRDRFRTIPNSININDNEEQTAWAYCYSAIYLADSLNLATQTSAEFLNNHTQVLQNILNSYNQKINLSELCIIDEIDNDHLGIEQEGVISSVRHKYAIYKLNKNADKFMQFNTFTKLGSRIKFLVNHRQLFEPEILFILNEQMLPTDQQFKDENLQVKKVVMDLSLFELINLTSREEVFNFDDELKEALFKLNEAIYSPETIISSLNSTNRLAQRKTAKLLSIFEDEDFIVELLELLVKWVKINAQTLKLTTKFNFEDVEDIIDNIEDYLIEEDDYVMLDIKKIMDEYSNINFNYFDINKVIKLYKNEVEINEVGEQNIKIYLTNMYAIYDIFRNMNEIATIKKA